MKILIVGPNWIGDAVMSISAMRMVRAAFPQAFIALLSRKWAEGVFQDAEFLDELITYDPSSSRIRSALERSRKLKGYSFDIGVLFPNSFESAFTLMLAGIPRRYGYKTDGRGLLLTDSIPVPTWKSKRHESQFYANLTEQMIRDLGGGLEVGISPSLPMDRARRNEARELLSAMDIDRDRTIIAIGAGSTNSIAKRWPVGYFAELCDALADRFDSQIILLGSVAESDIAKQLASLTRAIVFDLTGKTDLAIAASILAEVDLFVSNDMGLAHVSGALGTPTLTIFGPTNETATAPLGSNARFVREVVECSPCMLRECPIDHRCMVRLTPERVLETAAAMLEDRNI